MWKLRPDDDDDNGDDEDDDQLRLVEGQSPCENSDLIAFPGFQYQCRRHLSAEKENPVQKHQISDTMSHHSLDKHFLLRAFFGPRLNPSQTIHKFVFSDQNK